ncbi:hypothetical protein [Streptomyces sp. SID8499]|uniref:hypothetical protein n=1 Tax=Streptomyces sp. SID8499 TaxID=2706106 RepID=UPI0013CA8017|nr:hypothetical protein [Streptomyces sp. SID8499]NED32464.1 hypothetical protein [Streptomyces sp. SID8499]
MNKRPLPSGQGRKLDWTSVADCFDETTRPHTAWLWRALAHWTAEHGDPETGCQPRSKKVGEWLGVGASTVTDWRKGELWNPRWFGVVRERVGCDPATCDSPYADEEELFARLYSADQEEKAKKGSAVVPVRRAPADAGTVVPRPAGPPTRVGSRLDGSVTAQQDETRAALRKVDAVDGRTVRAWEAVVPLLDDPDRAAVHLRDVYVTRHAQKMLVRGLKNQLVNRSPQGSAVLGEPGTGKSCVLWGAREELLTAGWTVVAVSASALLGTPDHPADLRVQELLTAIEAWLSRTRGRKGPRPVALLLDTVDLLLHDDTDQGRNRLVTLVREARKLGAAVAVACRSAEARGLEDHDLAGIEALLSKEHLEGYDDGRAAVGAAQHVGAPWEPGSELDRAVEAYLRVFCREPGRPSPREDDSADGSRHRRGPVEPLAERMRSTLVYAAARGLPLGQLIRHPLSLRMLFDVYAPAGPRDKDIDVTDLFREYWEARVTEDVRHAVLGDDTADDEARWNLSGAVRVLGLAMLREGKPELRSADAWTALVAHADLRHRRAQRAVSVLLRRGVLRKVEGGRISFHHQAFAEHAAGQALRYAGRGLAATADRVTRHPDDLFLAEAAKHAFHIADRDGAAGWYPALQTLMRHDHAATRLTALRIHAGLRHPPQSAVSLAVETLRDADPWQTASYMTVLTGTSNPAPAAWPRTLRAVWDREDPQDRRRVLIAVTHLAHQQPKQVARFLSSLGLLGFADREQLKCLPYGRDLTLFLLGLHIAAPEKCATGVTNLIQAAVTFRNKSALLHTLTALAHLVTRHPGPYDDYAADLPELLDSLQQKQWQADLDKLVDAAAPAGAATLRAATATQIENTACSLAERLKTGPAGPSGALRLRALAEVLATRSRRLVHRCLNLLAVAAATPESAEPVAKYLLAPLLAQEPDRSGVAAARDWCRSHLSPTKLTDGLDAERGTRGVIAKALVVDKAPLPAATVAACLPTPPDPARCRESTLRRWLSDPWPPSLTVAAAAGGHPVAERALALHVTMEPPATDAYAARLREAIGRHAADHPGALLGPLQQDATHSGDLRGLKRLAGMGPDMLTAVLEHPGHRETLLAIAKILQDSPAGLKAVGVKLQTLATTRGGLLPATVDETVALLTATRNGEVQKAVLSSVGEQLHRHAAHWRNQDPYGKLTPVLKAMEDRGREVLSTAGPPYDHHARQFMLTANEAYLLRIALHAHFDDLAARPVDELLAPLEGLVFADLPLFLPPGDGEIALHAWRRRFEHLPHLCRRLADADHRSAARGLLDRVLDFTNRAHPSGKGNWRDGLANDWRRYLRVVSLEDREQLTDTILDFAVRDIAFAKQLVEVAGQSLGDISPELYALMRDPRTPPALMPALRSTASWAGRAAQGEAWTEVFTEVA